MPESSARRAISNVLYQRRTLTLLLLLTPPLLWFGVVYVGSLLTLLSQSVLTFDDMSMSVVAEFTMANFAGLHGARQYGHRAAHPGHGRCGHAGHRADWISHGLLHGTPCQSGRKGLFLRRRDAAHVGQLHRQSLCLDRAAGARRRDLLGAGRARSARCAASGAGNSR